MESNRRKSQQLGMDYGTAAHQLRRLATWELLVASGRDICFRCGRKMDSLSYSLDHTDPWLGVNNELFWDVSNISYSHKKCNSGATRPTRVPFTVAP